MNKFLTNVVSSTFATNKLFKILESAIGGYTLHSYLAPEKYIYTSSTAPEIVVTLNKAEYL